MQVKQLLIATDNGLLSCEHTADGWRESAHWLESREVTCVAARASRIVAGATDGLTVSDDGGATWRDLNDGLTIRHVRWLATHDGKWFVGTEPAGIFVMSAGEGAWRAISEVTELRDAGKWYLPYSPEAGCVRGFAFHGARAYAAVEVGGVLTSHDAGQSWQLAKGTTGKGYLGAAPASFVNSDVHSIETHPTSADIVLAATNGGLYRSGDGGRTWLNLYRCYCRALWVDSANPAHIIFGPADGVDHNGRIERTTDGGKNWQLVSDGLKTPMRSHMVERFLQVNDDLIAVLSNGQLHIAPLATLNWAPLLPAVTNAAAVASR